MAPVVLRYVVRFSSEDARNRAANLLKSSPASGSWTGAKSDTSGRIEAEFQFDKACCISHIDIGNSGSAFVELQVGSSMWPPDQEYKTLLPSTTFMKPAESKTWTHTCVVRMFNEESFSREVLSQQWDRIRIICRQPFRKDKQFGLSFIRIAAKDDEALPPTGSTVRSSDSNEGSKDGVMRLIKKASGFTDDTTRKYPKNTKTSPSGLLNRGAKMLQAALDSRSPKSTSTSSSASPKMRLSPSNKRNLCDEISCFLKGVNFSKLDFEHVTFADLRKEMERQRECPLTKEEKKLFFRMVRRHIEEIEEEEDATEFPSAKSHTPSRLTSRKTGRRQSEDVAPPAVCTRKNPASTCDVADPSKSSLAGDDLPHPCVNVPESSKKTRKRQSSEAAPPAVCARKNPANICDVADPSKSSPTGDDSSKKTRKRQNEAAPPAVCARKNPANICDVLGPSKSSPTGDDSSKKTRKRQNEAAPPAVCARKNPANICDIPGPSKSSPTGDDSSKKTRKRQNEAAPPAVCVRKNPASICDIAGPSKSSLTVDDLLHPDVNFPEPSHVMDKSEKSVVNLEDDLFDLPPMLSCSPVKKAKGETCSPVKKAKGDSCSPVKKTKGETCSSLKKTKAGNCSPVKNCSPLKETKVDIDEGKELVQCPLCDLLFPCGDIENHAAQCMIGTAANSADASSHPPQAISCPICLKEFPLEVIDAHADACAENMCKTTVQPAQDGNFILIS